MAKYKQDRYQAPCIKSGRILTGYICYIEDINDKKNIFQKKGKYFMHIHESGAEPKNKLYNIEVDGEKRVKV